MIKKLGEHVDRDPGVSVALGIGVPVAVDHDPGGVERAAGRDGQRAQAGDPRAVPRVEHLHGDGPASFRVAARGGQQAQLAGRGGREPRLDPVLLGCDHLGRGLADRQPPAQPPGFGVVVDQYGLAVLAAGQAIQRQGADFLGPPPCVDRDLDTALISGGSSAGRLWHSTRMTSGGRSRPGSAGSPSAGTSPGCIMKSPGSPSAGWPGPVRPSARIRARMRWMSRQTATLR